MKANTLLLFIVAIFIHLSGSAQELRKGPIIVCPIDPNSYDTHVPLAQRLSHLHQHEHAELARTSNATDFKSNIIVNYNGFTDEARTAFQFAVDIWASLIASDVDIIVNADFENLGAGVLGSAGASFFVRDFKNAPSDTTFYPIALAEKIAGEELNLPGQPEISCSFSSGQNFYFGTDGNTPENQFDFVSIVLHELGHGLGFAGTEFVNAEGVGSWDYFSNKTARYNQFVELSNGTDLVDIENNSTELGDVLTGDGLFFNGSLAIAAINGRPRLYAPAEYDPGSSFSHLDEAIYPAGDANSLMSPQIGRGESIFDPGVSLDIFADMGWFITVLDHEVDRGVIDNFNDEIPVEVTLRTDTNIVNNNLKVIYSMDDFESSSEILLNETQSGVYSASIPNPGTEGVLKYYFEGIEDGLGKGVRSPSVDGSYQVLVKQVASLSVPFLAAEGDFEDGNPGFFSIPLDGSTDVWELGTPANALTSSSTPTTVWKTGLDADYTFDDVSYKSALVSPYFDLSDTVANYVMSFELGMELFTSNDGNTFDTGPMGANLEVSTDGGDSWEVLGTVDDQAGENWYNFQNSGGGTFSTNVFDNNPGWIVDSVNTMSVSYNISSLANNSEVAFRLVFHVESDFLSEGYATDGVLFDNFEIKKEDPAAAFIVSNQSTIFFSGQEVAFEYISSGASSFSWDFGDGSTSTERNPTHAYAQGGVYDVSLTIQYDGGSDQVVQTGIVTVIAEAGSNYALEEGGNFEVDNGTMVIDNVKGTGFERGNSSIAGKDGTASGDFAIVTGLTATQYVDQSEGFLYTPVFDFSNLGNYEFSFKANYQTEDGWDGFIIEFTEDKGETWSQLEPEVKADWYDRIGEDNPIQGWPAIPLFTGTTNGAFVQKKVNVSSLGGGGEVGFRFHWLTDFASVDVGVAIDDFELSGPEPGPVEANFAVSEESGCVGHEVVFENTSTGTISDLSWDFGEGATPAEASGVGPHSVIYDEAGMSTAVLTATGPDGVDTKSFTIQTGALFDPELTTTENADGTVTVTSAQADSYQWFRDGEPIDGATGQSYTVDDVSEYNVSVVIDGCEQTSELVRYIPLSILDDEIGLAIWPNPANEFLNIRYKEEVQVQQVAIYDLAGALIYAFKPTSKEDFTIDTSGLNKGVYILELETNLSTLTEKVVIE